MGMCSYVIGFREADETFTKMEAAFNACKAAGIELPKAVCDFFEGENPDPKGVKINLGDAVEKWKDGYDSEGFQVDLTKLPKGIRYIRFINSY